MAISGKRLYTGQPGTTDTLLYTVPATTTTYVRAIHIANTTASAATIQLSLGATGAHAASKGFLWDVSIPEKGTYNWTGNQILETTNVIRALQGTAAALTLHISGIESSTPEA